MNYPKLRRHLVWCIKLYVDTRPKTTINTIKHEEFNCLTTFFIQLELCEKADNFLNVNLRFIVGKTNHFLQIQNKSHSVVNILKAFISLNPIYIVGSTANHASISLFSPPVGQLCISF